MARPRKVQNEPEPIADLAAKVADSIRRRATAPVVVDDMVAGPVLLDDGGNIGVFVLDGAAPVVPDGYAAREIIWPAHYWRIFDRQSARAGITTSKWLERLLAHMARE
jgi:hypothetical protein